MPEMRRGTLRFAYRDAGSGPAFVFQHGLGADAGQPASLAPRGYRLITLECRGHGGTSLGPPDELGFETLARDLDTLLDELRRTSPLYAHVRERPGDFAFLDHPSSGAAELLALWRQPAP